MKRRLGPPEVARKSVFRPPKALRGIFHAVLPRSAAPIAGASRIDPSIESRAAPMGGAPAGSDTQDRTPAQRRIGLLVLGLLFIASHASLFYGQFTGEDEALQWHACRRIIMAFSEHGPIQALRAIANILLTEYHPPLRYLLSLPGVWFIPRLEVGTRLGAILGSAWMTFLLSRIALKLGGARAAWITAFVVAASGVYVWTSMAFAWGWLTALVCAAVLLLWEPETLDLSRPGAMPRLWLAFCCLFGAYLVNSGAILFSVGLVLLLLSRHYRRLPQLILLGLPVAFMYGLYWAVFFLLPEHPGQLAQTARRFGMGGWNLNALVENLRGWNAYGFPLVFNLLWMAGLVVCFQQRRHLLWILLPFSLAWSFWLQGQSHQYFLLGTLPLLPWGLHAARHLLRGTLRPAFLIVAVYVWNLSLFQIPYPAKLGRIEAARPWIAIGLGYAGRWHNAREPWRKIARDLEAAVARGESWWSDLNGPFGIFYFPGEPGRRWTTSRYPKDPEAPRVWWILSDKYTSTAGHEVRTYEGSRLVLIRVGPTEPIP